MYDANHQTNVAEYVAAVLEIDAWADTFRRQVFLQILPQASEKQVVRHLNECRNNRTVETVATIRFLIDTAPAGLVINMN